MAILQNDIFWAALILFVLFAIFFLSRQIRLNQASRKMPPRTRLHNTTNYNIADPKIDESPLRDLSFQEAKYIQEMWKKEGYIPTDEEFHQLQHALKSDR